MSSKQQPSVRDKLFEQAESLGELRKEIEASELPSDVKEKLIAGVDSKLNKLAKAINSLLRN